MAQRSKAPPANVLYNPTAPPPCELLLKKFRNAVLSKPGMVMKVIKQQTDSIPNVNKIRDFSSGILKQLANVLKMERNMRQTPQSGFGQRAGFAADNFTCAAFGLDF
jgi:hypothetical protein